jgi:hypothetical protein
MKTPVCFALLTVMLFSATASADVSRQPIKLADLPLAVRKTALQQKQQATIERLEKTIAEGKEIYELELRSGIVTRTVFIDSTGKVVEVRQPTKLSEVTPAAKSVIENSVGDGTVVRLETVKIASGVIAAYQVKFRKNDRDFELRIGPDGRLVQE